MSFTDEEKKLIEEEENRAEEDIKARFKSFFSEEELADSAKEYKTGNPAESDERPKKEAEEKKPSRPLAAADNGASEKPAPKKKTATSKAPNKNKEQIKKSDKRQGQSKTPARRQAGDQQAKKSKRPRISGPDYALSGQKILSDSNYKTERERREERRRPTPASYRVSHKLYVFGQASIPVASNELTRNAKINDRSKVRKREKQLLKAGSEGRLETAKRAQVSVFSKEDRSARYSTAYDYQSAMEVASIVASGKVSQDTARISRETIDRFLADGELTRAEEERIAEARRAYGRGSGRRKIANRRQAEDAAHGRIKSVDNSRKSIRARERANKRVKEKSPAKVVVNLIVLALIIGICVFGYQMAKMVFDDAAMDPNNVSKIEFTVDENTNDDVVASFLVKNNMVENEMIYKIRAKIFSAEYVPGTYELSPSYSTEKIINILSGFDYSSGS